MIQAPSKNTPAPPGRQRIEDEARNAHVRRDWKAVLHILVRGYGASLRYYCGRLLGDESQADDVYQTILLQMLVHLPRFSGRSSFRVWLYAIARHRCLDALKGTRRRWRCLEQAEEGPEPRDPRESAEETLLREATHARLREELQRLPASSREALVLRYYEQLSYEEMAQRGTDKSSALRVRVSRALLRLRQSLDGPSSSFQP